MPLDGCEHGGGNQLLRVLLSFNRDIGGDCVRQKFLMLRLAVVREGIIEAEGEGTRISGQPVESGLGLAYLLLGKMRRDGSQIRVQ
jgi:hypothetical protein